MEAAEGLGESKEMQKQLDAGNVAHESRKASPKNDEKESVGAKHRSPNEKVSGSQSLPQGEDVEHQEKKKDSNEDQDGKSHESDKEQEKSNAQ